MAEKKDKTEQESAGISGSFKKSKSSGGTSGGAELPALFAPKDFDIYVNKISGEVVIFHGPELKHDVRELIYRHSDRSVTVRMADGSQMDLGAKIQWLIRPYFIKAKTIMIIRTQNGEAIDGIEVPLTIIKDEA